MSYIFLNILKDFCYVAWDGWQWLSNSNDEGWFGGTRKVQDRGLVQGKSKHNKTVKNAIPLNYKTFADEFYNDRLYSDELWLFSRKWLCRGDGHVCDEISARNPICAKFHEKDVCVFGGDKSKVLNSIALSLKPNEKYVHRRDILLDQKECTLLTPIPSWRPCSRYSSLSTKRK